MADWPFRFGPKALTVTTTVNLLHPGSSSPGDVLVVPSVDRYLSLRHVRIVNKSGSDATFSLWLGGDQGNASGTEVIGTGTNVPANTAYDWYGDMRIDSDTWLVGGASANTSLVIQGEGFVCAGGI